MKRSKIFLGLTASVLAVAAFAATKAKSPFSKTCYVTAGTAKTIISYGNVLSAQTIGTTSTELKAFGRQLYTYVNSTHKCVLPLYTEQ